MTIKLRYILIVLAVVLTACGQVMPAAPTLTPTEMPIVPNATASFLETNCIHILPAPSNMKIEGTIVFSSHRGQSIVLMGENNLKIPEEFKGNNRNSEQSVSPDGTFLMYRQMKYVSDDLLTSIVVITSDGHTVLDFPDRNDGAIGIFWLSDEYIRYPTKNQKNQSLRLYALNVQTGKIQNLRMDFPDMPDKSSPDWGVDSWEIYFGVKKGTNVMYDPFLTRVVYPNVQPSPPLYSVSLFDVQNNKELASIETSLSFDPKWSPDGKYFSIVGEDLTTSTQDIFIVMRDGGQFSLLTNLAKTYPKVNFGSYNWSPNSKQIVFWANTDESQIENNLSLMLFDFTGLKTTDLCIKGFGRNRPFGTKSTVDFELRGKPIWSPDGKKLLITQYDEDAQEIVDILIDLENKIAYPIARGLEPIGWMK